ncbi:hypothetical protein TNCV_1704041 [Trichonephila clavipes]|nr:hypothetical protein TNCV_1704041 [Trichonephila clavipes]
MPKPGSIEVVCSCISYSAFSLILYNLRKKIFHLNICSERLLNAAAGLSLWSGTDLLHPSLWVRPQLKLVDLIEAKYQQRPCGLLKISRVLALNKIKFPRTISHRQSSGAPMEHLRDTPLPIN